MVYYEPGNPDCQHGLEYDPFKSCVVPRPIGWISTISPDGTANLAPYSQFQNLTFDPPYVMFSANNDATPERAHAGGRKDTTFNAETAGEFVWNMATYDLRDAVNKTAAHYAPGVDEFDKAGLTKAPSRIVKVPRVAESPVQFECKYHTTLRLPGNSLFGTVDVVIGRVVAVHIKEEALTNGRVDVKKIKPLARCGYMEYTYIQDTFEMRIPPVEGATGTVDGYINAGLEGNATKLQSALDNAGKR